MQNFQGIVIYINTNIEIDFQIWISVHLMFLVKNDQAIITNIRNFFIFVEVPRLNLQLLPCMINMFQWDQFHFA